MSKLEEAFDAKYEKANWTTGALRLAFLEVFAAGAAYAKERDAEICDEHSADKWNLYKGRAPYTGREDGRADPYVQGQSDGAENCATLIREQEE